MRLGFVALHPNPYLSKAYARVIESELTHVGYVVATGNPRAIHPWQCWKL